MQEINIDDLLDGELKDLIRRKRRENKIKEAAKKLEPPVYQSPWRAKARVLVIEEVHCRCGATFSAPGARDLLVQFQHERSGALWETSDHPSVKNPELPLVQRTIGRTVHACSQCVGVEQELSMQEDMFRDWYEPLSCFLSEPLQEVHKELMSISITEDFINE